MTGPRDAGGFPLLRWEDVAGVPLVAWAATVAAVSDSMDAAGYDTYMWTCDDPTHPDYWLSGSGTIWARKRQGA